MTRAVNGPYALETASVRRECTRVQQLKYSRFDFKTSSRRLNAFCSAPLQGIERWLKQRHKAARGPQTQFIADCVIGPSVRALSYCCPCQRRHDPPALNPPPQDTKTRPASKRGGVLIRVRAGCVGLCARLPESRWRVVRESLAKVAGKSPESRWRQRVVDPGKSFRPESRWRVAEESPA